MGVQTTLASRPGNSPTDADFPRVTESFQQDSKGEPGSSSAASQSSASSIWRDNAQWSYWEQSLSHWRSKGVSSASTMPRLSVKATVFLGKDSPRRVTMWTELKWLFLWPLTRNAHHLQQEIFVFIFWMKWNKLCLIAISFWSTLDFYYSKKEERT